MKIIKDHTNNGTEGPEEPDPDNTNDRPEGPEKPAWNDFDDLSLPQNFDELLRTRTVRTSCPVRKPHRHEWIRTHPTWRQSAYVLKLSGEKRDELWLLKPELVPRIPRDLVVPMLFIPTITRQGAIFMWPCRLPNPSGRHDPWATTALVAARVAQTTWVQVYSDMNAQAYTYRVLDETVDEPVWPDDLSWDELRELGLRSHVIDTWDHPTLDAVLHGK